ncbi:MAG TPA: LysR substrate-binding domain-containing protein [Aliidongia sp.]|uniref:LysR substrate-binding domain-containing protein n=1 Tax=Aliidongia sp. TaxID=1914230 RepID=UPI002DDCFC99|nr:LysR substrate-binding domain-containing protein [Aliidongia sp.]HEV2674746.1 LysR substrate-binding domain-containing protein [Aliidongia sp.]
MRRHLSLRQVEAFKAVIEHGTISRAAAALHVSQPAMSKMIASLESDADLELFDRVKGRLAPTQRGMRLYDEIDRIFAGVQQVENAVDAIRREDQGRIAIGVMPALSGSFVQQVTKGFLERHPQAFCVVESRSSPRLAEWLVTRKLDVGLVEPGVDNPYLVSEPLMEHPLVCIMPAGHALAAKSLVRPADLDGLPFVSFTPEGFTGQRVTEMFAEYRVRLNVVLVASMASTLCEFVATGHGISLVHPVMVKAFGERLVARRFEPAIPLNFRICRSRDGRNARLVDDFVAVAHETARRVLTDVDGDGPGGLR